MTGPRSTLRLAALEPRRPILVAVGDEEGDRAPNYVHALVAVGVPEERIRVLTPDRSVGAVEPGGDPEAWSALAASAAGLVLAGGDDLDPRLYGEEILPEARNVIDAPRDAMELALLAGAREARVPTWGVCRGLQVANVFLGGTLWQDLAIQVPTTVPHNLKHPKDALLHAVDVEHRERPLGRLLAREGQPLVNSRHHQALKALAPGLVPVARSADRLVEAAVLDAPDWWFQGVQWHPENLIDLDLHRALWQSFADAMADRWPSGERRAS